MVYTAQPGKELLSDDDLALAEGTWEPSSFGKLSIELQSKDEAIETQGVMLISWRPAGGPSSQSWQVVGNATAIETMNDGVSHCRPAASTLTP